MNSSDCFVNLSVCLPGWIVAWGDTRGFVCFWWCERHTCSCMLKGQYDLMMSLMYRNNAVIKLNFATITEPMVRSCCFSTKPAFPERKNTHSEPYHMAHSVCLPENPPGGKIMPNELVFGASTIVFCRSQFPGVP